MVDISIQPTAINSLAAVGAFIGLCEFVKLFFCWVQHPLYLSECAHFPFSMCDNFTAHTFSCNPVRGRIEHKLISNRFSVCFYGDSF